MLKYMLKLGIECIAYRLDFSLISAATVQWSLIPIGLWTSIRNRIKDITDNQVEA